MKRRAPLRSGLCQRQRAFRKIERSQVPAAGEADLRRAPVQPSGDHQMNHQPEISLQTDRDPFADVAQAAYNPAIDAGERRLRCSQKERAGEAHSLERLTDGARLERADVGEDVRELRHALQSQIADSLSAGYARRI